VQRLLPHHRYVCTRHPVLDRPPDVGQPVVALEDPELHDLVRAQRRHLRLLRRYGTAAAFDAVLTGFLICGHLWDDWRQDWHEICQRWTRCSHYLIPVGCELTSFSANRLFAAVYAQAVELAQVIASPIWGSRARLGDLR